MLELNNSKYSIYMNEYYPNEQIKSFGGLNKVLENYPNSTFEEEWDNGVRIDFYTYFYAINKKNAIINAKSISKKYGTDNFIVYNSNTEKVFDETEV